MLFLYKNKRLDGLHIVSINESISKSGHLPDLILAATIEVVEVEDVLPVAAPPRLQVSTPVTGCRRPLEDRVEGDGGPCDAPLGSDHAPLRVNFHQLSCLLKHEIEPSKRM